jgi:hypothetical protein
LVLFVASRKHQREENTGRRWVGILATFNKLGGNYFEAGASFAGAAFAGASLAGASVFGAAVSWCIT